MGCIERQEGTSVCKGETTAGRCVVLRFWSHRQNVCSRRVLQRPWKFDTCLLLREHRSHEHFLTHSSKQKSWIEYILRNLFSLSIRFSQYAQAGLPRFLSPPVSVFNSSLLIVSLPFSPGNANVSLFPPFNPSHNPIFPRFVHVKSPTYGCTFQCNVNVAFSFSASLPEMSVIWYLGFWFWSFKIPGEAPGGWGLPTDFGVRDFLDLEVWGDLGVGWM